MFRGSLNFSKDYSMILEMMQSLEGVLVSEKTKGIGNDECLERVSFSENTLEPMSSGSLNLSKEYSKILQTLQWLIGVLFLANTIKC